MKKLVSLILSIALIFSLAMPAMAATMNQEISSDAIQPGEEVTVTVTLDEAMTDIVMYQYSLYYNKDLFTLTSSEGSTAVISNPLSDEDGDYYMISFVDTTSMGQTIEAGTIAVLKFQAKAEMTEAEAGSFRLEKDYVWDTSYTDTGDAAVTNAQLSVNVAPVVKTYTVTLTEGEGYTIAASEGSASPVNEGGSYSFTVAINEGYEGTPVIKANNTELTAVDGVYTIENIAADQTVTVSGVAPKSGAYVVTASDDVTTNVGGSASVSVIVTGNSDAAVTGYNDYDVTIAYAPENLTYVSAVGADDNAVITNDAAAGTIRITGHGAAKEYSTAVVTLSFTANASGNHNVTISTAKIDNSGHAIAGNAADAAISDATTVVKVAYPVTLPEGFEGESSVLPGEDYTFTAPEDAEHLDITVTVGGNVVDLESIDNGDGTYTIPGVEGDVVITAEGKTYNVTTSGTNAAVNGEATAQYGKDYTFTVTPDGGYTVTAVSILVGDTAVSYSIDSTGAYVVAGKDIKGDITIAVTASAPAANTTQITFSGIPAEEVVGGLIQTAINGEDFVFELNEVEGYKYTVTVGDLTLTPDADGKYTIPGSLVNGTPLTVTIVKAEKEPVSADITVSEYITLDEGVMWLVTATDGDKVLAYGDNGAMYWSDKYNAYCWLVVSSGTAVDVKNAAEAAIVEAAEGTVAPVVSYDFDVNQTGVVDVNDAQLAYDMYTAVYDGFDQVSMDKFLEADQNGDGKVYTEDAAAIVNQIHPTAQN